MSRNIYETLQDLAEEDTMVGLRPEMVAGGIEYVLSVDLAGLDSLVFASS